MMDDKKVQRQLRRYRIAVFGLYPLLALDIILTPGLWGK